MASDDLALLGLTAQIVAAHVGFNQVAPGDLPGLIRSVYDTLRTVPEPVTLPAAPMVPAVPIKRSIQHEHLICLEDGKKLKTLKRHLMVSFGLTPNAYRAKWGLPSDYPMVAPAYAEFRSNLAKKLGLGRSRSKATPAAPKPKRVSRRSAKKA